MMRFAHKVALVTGGRSGIGLAIAERLRDEGARVFTAQRLPADAFETIEADLADTRAPGRVIDELIARAGKLDVLVNNAGVMQEAGIGDMSLEDWERTLRVNLTAPFLLIQAALPHLRLSRGAIVNVGSIEGLGSNPRHAAYCASKAGLHGLTRAVAVDHGQDGIRCKRGRAGVDRHRPQRGLHREHAGPRRLPARHRPHPSRRPHWRPPRGRGARRLPGRRGERLRHRTGLYDRRGPYGEAQPALNGNQICPHRNLRQRTSWRTRGAETDR